MNMKYLMMSSVVALVSASAAQAADVVIPQNESVTNVVVAPSFSWTGFYIGGQVGSFSSDFSWEGDVKDTSNAQEAAKAFFAEKDPRAPDFSGFHGGLFAGYNIDLSKGFILGVDTDVMWSKNKSEESSPKKVIGAGKLDEFNEQLQALVTGQNGAEQYKFEEGDTYIQGHVFKEKVTGATRVRLGFTSGRIMPYVAGGIAYAQMQNTFSVAFNKNPAAAAAAAAGVTRDEEGSVVVPGPSATETDPKPPVADADPKPPVASDGQDPVAGAGQDSVVAGAAQNKLPVGPVELLDKKTNLVGFTIAAGVDFAVTDNFILHAEYRHSDYGKKKVLYDTAEMKYKTDELRVGVAYKF
ncbi:hemin binding protein [Bartonella australis AUST/NH1]|uniref:Hemin binding protein n=1 Tax=Bartonella australis (strain Aust/NH1) TaxID=1094489 RepID=M1N2E6_BARAA|nr:outer membrane beta-barrel protein [Bartonella australis]AGF74074.1 hemin binding protein [Bartonella australis AUST/NH1]